MAVSLSSILTRGQCSWRRRKKKQEMRPEMGPNQAEPCRTVKVFCLRVKYRVLGGGAKVKRRTTRSHMSYFSSLSISPPASLIITAPYHLIQWLLFAPWLVYVLIPRSGSRFHKGRGFLSSAHSSTLAAESGRYLVRSQPLTNTG